MVVVVVVVVVESSCLGNRLLRSLPVFQSRGDAFFSNKKPTQKEKLETDLSHTRTRARESKVRW